MTDFYGTAAGFRAYHAARDNDIPADAANDAFVNAALLVASEWLDPRYVGSFNGLKVGMRTQLREWPRLSAFDRYGYVIPSDSVPKEIENATYEAALRHMLNPGSLAVDYTPSVYRSVAVDGAINVQYNTDRVLSAVDVQTQFTVIDHILSNLIGSGAGGGLSGDASRV